jgi:glycine/D-amino acid oxidase-like deaminating enzyme
MQYDVVMVGGGVMGCATAYYLLKLDPTLRVAIIEKDPDYTQNSTILSDGNLRVQFNIKENIQMSLYGLEVLARFGEEMAVGQQRPEVAFLQQGNLFMVGEADREEAIRGMELQNELGGEVTWLEIAEIQRRYPFIDGDLIVGGTLGALDGTMDPQAVLVGYRNKAVALGAQHIIGEVTAILVENEHVKGIRLGDGNELHSAFVINSSGAWGKHLAQTAGINIPVEPVMRHVFHLETRLSVDEKLPMLFFPSGLYLVHEHGNHFTCGKSLPTDPIGFDFTFQRQLFIDHIWEDLVTYAPEFEHLKVVGGWAGLYDVNTFDGNVLLGDFPQARGFLMVNGFSGHGFQQCHAVGRYLAEKILGREYSLDLSIFDAERLLHNSPVFEHPHKIV